jgi:hypothetical protein
MDMEASAAAIQELAKGFIELVETIDPDWERAFYRFEFQEERTRANGSIVRDGSARIIDVLQTRGAFGELTPLAEAVVRATPAPGGKLPCILLLTVTSDFDFETEFDYDSTNRWHITKSNGGTGFPK